MEWTQVLRKSIDYMEQHLLSDCKIEDIAMHVNISPFYFQKGFKLMTGYTIGEYIRNRRLYLAALDVIQGDEKIINLAYKYGYDTPESFTKAFNRFHGISPMQIKNQSYKLKAFQPLQISIAIRGGSQIDYTIESMDAFQVIGIERVFQYETAFQKIPKFWSEYCREYRNEFMEKLRDCCIGMYGVSIAEGMNDKEFRYLIAGKFHGEKIPEGLHVVEIPAFTWVKFRCVGPMPETLQALNTRIFHEWLPGHEEYEIAGGYNIELYDDGEIKDIDYKSEIWVPIKKN